MARDTYDSVVGGTYDAMLARIAEIVARTAWDRDLPAALTSCVACQPAPG